MGTKKFEFRKTFPDDVDKIFLYVSYPYKEIVGYITPDGIYNETINNLRELTKKEWTDFDSEKDGFDDYFRLKPQGVAIKIGEVFVFDEPINPFEFEGFAPPQSYYVLNKELEEFILEQLWTKSAFFNLAQPGTTWLGEGLCN